MDPSLLDCNPDVLFNDAIDHDTIGYNIGGNLELTSFFKFDDNNIESFALSDHLIRK